MIRVWETHSAGTNAKSMTQCNDAEGEKAVPSTFKIVPPCAGPDSG